MVLEKWGGCDFVALWNSETECLLAIRIQNQAVIANYQGYFYNCPLLEKRPLLGEAKVSANTSPDLGTGWISKTFSNALLQHDGECRYLCQGCGTSQPVVFYCAVLDRYARG